MHRRQHDPVASTWGIRGATAATLLQREMHPKATAGDARGHQDCQAWTAPSSGLSASFSHPCGTGEDGTHCVSNGEMRGGEDGSEG